MSQQRSQTSAVLAVVLTSYFMIVVDASIVITGLERIQHDLAFSAAGLAWMQDAYLLVFGGLLLLGGRMGDVLGRRRILIVGLGIFTFASMIVGLAPSPSWAIAGRGLQGLGSAIVAPTTLALLSTNFPEGPQRTRALAWYATTSGLAASIGLVVGGLLADWLSWRVGFFINLPIGIVLLFCARRYLSETERGSGNFDISGAISSTIGMGALVFGTVRSAEYGWHDAIVESSLVAGAVSLVLFILAERRAAHPITPLRLFKSGQRSAALVGRFLYMGALISYWFFASLLIQGVVGFSPAMTGIAFLPMTICNFGMALAIPYATRRFGNERVLAGAIFVSMLGMGWLAQASAGSGYFASIALPMMLIGLGQGAALPSLTVAAIRGASPGDAGAVSGLVNAVHQLGGSMGLALLTTVSISAGAKEAGAAAQLARRVSIGLDGGAVMLALALILAGALWFSSIRIGTARREGIVES